jgi:hypothetical protein
MQQGEIAPWPAATPAVLPPGRPFLQPQEPPLAPSPPMASAIGEHSVLETWEIILIVVGVTGALLGIIACTWLAAMYTLQHWGFPTSRTVPRDGQVHRQKKSPTLPVAQPSVSKQDVVPPSTRPSIFFKLRHSQRPGSHRSSHRMWSRQYTTSSASARSSSEYGRGLASRSSITAFSEHIGLRDADAEYYDLVALPGSVRQQLQAVPVATDRPQSQRGAAGARKRSKDARRPGDSPVWTHCMDNTRSHAVASSSGGHAAGDASQTKGAIMYRMAEAMQVR